MLMQCANEESTIQDLAITEKTRGFVGFIRIGVLGSFLSGPCRVGCGAERRLFVKPFPIFFSFFSLTLYFTYKNIYLFLNKLDPFNT